MDAGLAGSRAAIRQPIELMLGTPAAKWLPHLYIVKYFCCRWNKIYYCNDKILTYGPSNNVFTDEIRPFIHMYFRRTILSGPKPIKSSLSRGDILFKKFSFLVFQTRNLVIFLEWAVKNRITRLWCTTI